MFEKKRAFGMVGEPWRAAVLLGPTGSGKTPLGRLLEAKGYLGTSCIHFDFGANLREIAGDPGSPERFEEEELQTIRRSLETGALFENEDFGLALKILRRFVQNRRMRSRTLIILNGFPRHEGQAEALDEFVTVERVVFLDGTDRIIRERLRLDTGGDRGERADREEAVKMRLSIFRERTLPLLLYYERRGVPFIRIAATTRMSADEMYDRLNSGVIQKFD